MPKPVIYIILGPNHNMLGQREPDLYGTQTMGDVEAFCSEEAAKLGVEIDRDAETVRA